MTTAIYYVRGALAGGLIASGGYAVMHDVRVSAWIAVAFGVHVILDTVADRGRS